VRHLQKAKVKTLKYNVEFFLEFSCIDRFIFRVSDIGELENITDELKERLGSCHIYLICKRPRIALQLTPIRLDDDFIYLELNFRILGNNQLAEVKLPRKIFSSEEVRFEVSKFPHREMNTYDSNGNQISTVLLANFVHLFEPLPDEVKDLKVLYIGKGLKKSAKDRLESHSTLQKILADINSNEPDMEVFVLVYSFPNPKKNTAIMRHSGMRTEIQGRVANERNKKVIHFKPSLDLQVALIEASLISYFKTEKYNTHYIDFPNGKYKSLKEFYEMDFAALLVSIDNENIGMQRIFSDAIKASHIHQARIDFRKLEGKFSFFEQVHS
jgi:hypothetical protein